MKVIYEVLSKNLFNLNKSKHIVEQYTKQSNGI